MHSSELNGKTHDKKINEKLSMCVHQSKCIALFLLDSRAVFLYWSNLLSQIDNDCLHCIHWNVAQMQLVRFKVSF